MAAPTTNARGAGYWNSAAGHNWVALQSVIGEVFTSVTKLSFDAAAAKPGDRVIDIGCGTGDTVLDFANVVGPSGAVLGVDISVPMLGFAEHRASESGNANISFARADATTYAFEPDWADLVYSRFGVMFFDDSVKAFANIRSGMKAGGRVRVFPDHAGELVVPRASGGRAAASAAATAIGSAGARHVHLRERAARPKDPGRRGLPRHSDQGSRCANAWQER